MFDVGFWELALLGVVALLIIGPERLPQAARTAGMWLGRARRMAREVKAEIDREIREHTPTDLDALKTEIESAGGEFHATTEPINPRAQRQTHQPNTTTRAKKTAKKTSRKKPTHNKTTRNNTVKKTRAKKTLARKTAKPVAKSKPRKKIKLNKIKPKNIKLNTAHKKITRKKTGVNTTRKQSAIKNSGKNKNIGKKKKLTQTTS